ncbi:hypothetical protein B0A48_17464 [Cryoendolithus antarcticus]|uniref:Holocytochrome c-type synthase n=1 Tax=Cryoendolithus antarcticus TaxID=1507870 RepID=A0A1V8SD93_9PEZI|nr:hypothetical protein B0A48_17464 [Cryoendolithus antarcticus]
MRPEGSDPDLKCPVDPKTREKWLEAAKAKKAQGPKTSAPLPSTPSPLQRYSLDTGRWQSGSQSSPTNSTTPRRPRVLTLDTHREISTIPRALPSADKPLNTAERAALPPANSEADSGQDNASGNWIYPSQEMFFAAMKRKGHEANPADMNSIVPIHNAVNERAWTEIKNWERRRGSEVCGGPKLVSFAGNSKALTPKARVMGWMGYEAPFDRHDWVVDRCGTRVEYVIDFYSGKDEGLKVRGSWDRWGYEALLGMLLSMLLSWADGQGRRRSSSNLRLPPPVPAQDELFESPLLAPGFFKIRASSFSLGHGAVFV